MSPRQRAEGIAGRAGNKLEAAEDKLEQVEEGTKELAGNLTSNVKKIAVGVKSGVDAIKKRVSSIRNKSKDGEDDEDGEEKSKSLVHRIHDSVRDVLYRIRGRYRMLVFSLTHGW